METFVSWSGSRSRAFAEAVVEWLRNVLYLSHPWMSDQIQPGTRWSEVIGSKLGAARMGLLCVTPENVQAPWLLFEAGALSNRFGNVGVVPLLFDMAASDLDGPLSQFQSVAFGRDAMLTLARTINQRLGRQKVADDVLKKSCARQWREFVAAVDKARSLPIESATLPGVLKALKKHGLPEPSEGHSLNFEKGFESHQLYEAVFAQARKRLYIFGRKNRKVFDREHDDFFASLATKQAEGFDFKCLFLDPNAPSSVMIASHAAAKFRHELKTSIEQARTRLRKHKISPSEVCRTYKIPRTHAVVIIDELVLFAPTTVDAAGKPKRLTKSAFKLVDAADSFGGELLNLFLDIWKNKSQALR